MVKCCLKLGVLSASHEAKSQYSKDDRSERCEGIRDFQVINEPPPDSLLHEIIKYLDPYFRNYLCHLFFKKKTNLYIPKWKSLYFSRSSQIAKRGVKDPSLHYPQGKHPGLITAAILDFTEHSSCTGSVNSYLPV